MSRPRVAIVGSVDETREFDPELKDPATARKACEELGRAFAEAGWDIVVYSAKATFIEGDVVRGYASSDAAVASSIHVHAPLGKGSFEEIATRRELFDERADPSRDWEVSFYRSLPSCDGVLVVGGGRSTLVTGLIALAMRIPIVALAAFGGNGQKVWDHLVKEQGDASEDDIHAMAKNWFDDSAHSLVAALDGQRRKRAERKRDELRQARNESLRRNVSLALAAVLLILAVAALVFAWGARPGTGGSIALLVATPAMAGTAGALIKAGLDGSQQWVTAGVQGICAGLITGVLYVASQLIGAPNVLDVSNPEGVRRLLFFVLPIGFVAGLTFDAVIARWAGANVSQTDTLETLTNSAHQSRS